jgi:hypothetical protein
VLKGKREVGFAMAAYDVTKPLVIDPTLVYSTYLGGSSDDEGFGIAVDSPGSAYVTGLTNSINFPTANPIQATNAGRTDAFVTKVNAAGNALVYSTYLGGSTSDEAFGIAVDSLGSAYVTGQTNSTNFPTANPIQAANAGGVTDGFVTKINAAGSALAYSTYLGGSNTDQGSGIAVDSLGSAYVTGLTNSTNFPTANPIQAANAGGLDAFVTKVNAAGSALAYSTYLGGSSHDEGFGIAVDSLGSAYVTGFTQSTNFPTANPIQAANAGSDDAFVTKVNAVGSALVYSTYLGGSSNDEGFGGIAVDGLGNAYVTGRTGSTDFPTTPGTFQTTNASGGCCDAFVTKLVPLGTPAMLTLAPKTATNTVGTTHCVTSTVEDPASNPVPGVTVIFSVPTAVATHASPASGSAATDTNGQATFCYSASLPGQDAIHAFADTDGNGQQDAGEPFDDATKTWTPPASTAFCEVTITNGGWIIADNGDLANFGGNAKVSSDGSSVQGQEQYQDKGPAQPLNVHSISLAATTCSSDLTSATIFGTATIDGSGIHVFRIDVTDAGSPGRNDTYGIILDTGYASGQKQLQGGNVTIHK